MSASGTEQAMDLDIEIETIDSDPKPGKRADPGPPDLSSDRESQYGSKGRQGHMELSNLDTDGSSTLRSEDVILTDHDDERIGSYSADQFESHRSRNLRFRYAWAHRTLYTDWFATWLAPFVDYHKGKTEVSPDHLHVISEEEKAENLYRKWCKEMREDGYSIKQTVWKLTIQGMLKYGFQLAVVELSTMAAIYSIRLIIDYLHDHIEPFGRYHVALFFSFNFFRMVAILVRNYYDLHVYNYFRFVQTAIQAWVFEEVNKLRLWKKIKAADSEARNSGSEG